MCILEDILARKALEVARLKKRLNLYKNGELVQALQNTRSSLTKNKLVKSLRRINLSIIAEIKRTNPIISNLITIEKTSVLSERYMQGGANAISVITDQAFLGNINDLYQTTLMTRLSNCSVLRKDFIIDEIQIIETKLSGADAVLLMVSVLKNKTGYMLQQVEKYGLEAIVEVYTEDELKYALDIGARVIFVNNRNLRTYALNHANAFNLVDKIPADVIRIAGSGVNSAFIAQELHSAGFDAVFVGEALLKADQPYKLIGQMKAAA